METSPRVSPALRYLYAIVQGLPGAWRPPPVGVGGAIVTQPFRELLLISSPLASPLPRTPGAEAGHDDVVASLLEAPAVLPFRFGTVVAEAELESWLEARWTRIRAGLAELRGRVEMSVRLLPLDQRTADSAAGDLTGAALRILADRLVERAGLTAWRYCPAGRGANLTASVAFLVPREEVPAFLARIAPVAARAEHMAVVPTGPWPAYSFTPSLETGASVAAASA
ncbi:MAG: GvpL/GvpF family gas vesicle protein [Candidatus Rokuibacteriota bacterium]